MDVAVEARTLSCQRTEYALATDDRYLNAAALSPQLRAVSEVGAEVLRRKERPGQFRREHWLQPVQELRGRFAGLLGVRPDSIATVPSVSYGLASVAKNVRLRRGQRIVTVADVFPSTYYTWSAYAKTRGCELAPIAAPANATNPAEAWNEALLESIDERCGLVCLPPIHWSDGTLYDLVAIRGACDRVGALLVVDATQYVGARPFDTDAVRPDALVCAGYKWLGGPYGLGYLYMSERFDDGTPIEENWMNRSGSEDFSRLTDYTDVYRPGAMRYSVGEQSNFIHVAMANAALQQLADWSLEGVADYTALLMAPFWERFEALGYRLNPEDYRTAHLFGLELTPRTNVESLKAKLAERHLTVSFRGRYLRVSAHISTRGQDLAQLCEVLSEFN